LVFDQNKVIEKETRKKQSKAESYEITESTEIESSLPLRPSAGLQKTFCGAGQARLNIPFHFWPLTGQRKSSDTRLKLYDNLKGAGMDDGQSF